jgi:hypothetical protein
MIYLTKIFGLAMLPVQLWAAETVQPAAVTRESFMAAMRSSKAWKDDRDRKQRLYSSIMEAAVTPQKRSEDFRELAYYTDDTYSNYGFDISSYSLKYAGCSAISTYSDELAQDEDATTVFETEQYVIFRFCPSKKCQEKSTYGCMSDYGEYMVPIATWLDIMKDFRDEEFERYCEYCQNCAQNNNRNMENVYYAEANDDVNDDAAGDDAYAAANDDGNAATDDGNSSNNSNYCAYSSDCSGYQNVCNYDAGVDYSKFFECKEFQVSDDFTLYIGPHCAKDKTTIVLGAFTDDACTKYAGNKYDLGTLTGMKLTSSDLNQYYTSDCIPCKESVSFFVFFSCTNMITIGSFLMFLIFCCEIFIFRTYLFKTLQMIIMTTMIYLNSVKICMGMQQSAIVISVDIHPNPISHTNKKIQSMQFALSLHQLLLERMMSTDTFTWIRQASKVTISTISILKSVNGKVSSLRVRFLDSLHSRLRL